MEKPIVFLSHSSADEKPLKVLKHLLHTKTGGAVTLFLSSDGQSIPLGRNWVHELEQSLDKSGLMFVFISPHSLRSSWIHFEAGFAYSKGIRVVPVGVLGVDLGQLAPPLSLLQGFNITSEAGLNNLIAIVNQVFEHEHTESFKAHDYEAIFNNDSSGKGLSATAQLVSLVENIHIQIKRKVISDLDTIEQYLKRKSIEYTRLENTITTYGLTAITKEVNYETEYLELSISSELAGAILPVVGEFLAEVLGGADETLSVRIEFSSAVQRRKGHHNVTARLYGSNISLGAGETLQYGDISFTLDNIIFHGISRVTQGAAYVRVMCKVGQLQSLDIGGLLFTLFEYEVLYLQDSQLE